MIRKVCVIGHFAKGENLLNGQTVKTKIVTKELVRVFGKKQVKILDTHGIALPKVPFQCVSALKNCKNVIVMPAENGLRVLGPLLVIINSIFKRKLHYVVIGGWLPSFIEDRSVLAFFLKKFDGIYVETKSMKTALVERGFKNIEVVSNCKELNILPKDEMVISDSEPYRLCTFSRVMKEKGIEDAVNAVRSINKSFGRAFVSLDIYGQVENTQKEWFENLRKTFPTYIRYGGLIPFDQSTEVLKNYFALLFPTYYEGEGFAGTLIDAMAAGIPVLASNWKYNNEIVIDGVNGYVFDLKADNLEETILRLISDKKNWRAMKYSSLDNANLYLPEFALRRLIDALA